MGKPSPTKAELVDEVDLPAKQPRRRSVPICFDDAASERLTVAEVAVQVATSDLERTIAFSDLDAAKAAVRDATRWYHFLSCGHRRYDELLDDHPPTERQMEKYAEQLDAERRRPLGERVQVVPPFYNVKTFAPALIAATLVEISPAAEPDLSRTEPLMTAAAVDAMTAGPAWNVAEMSALFEGALDTIVTTGRTLGKGFG